MKKISAFLLCGVMAFGLAGCDSTPKKFVETDSPYKMCDFVSNTNEVYNNFIREYENAIVQNETGNTKMAGYYKNGTNALKSEFLNLDAVMPFVNYLLENSSTFLNVYYQGSLLTAFQFKKIDDRNYYVPISANHKTDSELTDDTAKTNSFMPCTFVQADTSSCVDQIDYDLIMNWGNCLKYTITTNSTNSTENIVEQFKENGQGLELTLSQKFYFPTIANSDTLSQENGYKIVSDDINKKITLVYKVESQIFTKEVFFETINGQTTKTVFKYNYDRITESESSTNKLLGSYTYAISDMAFMGDYDLSYDRSKSYFKSKHSATGTTNKTIIEFCSFDDGSVIARYNANSGANVSCYDYYIDSGAINGRMKYKTSSEFCYLSGEKYTEKYNQSTYASLTNEENSAYVFEFQNNSDTGVNKIIYRTTK